MTHWLTRMRTAMCALITLAAAGPLFTAFAQDVDVRPTERAAPRDTLERARYTDPIDIVSLGLDVATMGARGSFFDTYTALGGAETSTSVYAAPRLMGRLVMGPQLRLAIDVAFHRTGLTEQYEVRTARGPDGRYIATVFEELSAMAVPILAGIEYAPVRTQFTSYVGAVAGPAVTMSRWTSSVEHATNGYTRPRTNTDGLGIAPAFRLYAGVDLRFDKLARVPSAFRGIFFEVGWLYLPVTRGFFEAIRKEGGASGPGVDSDTGTLYLGGLTITFGLNLQVLRRS